MRIVVDFQEESLEFEIPSERLVAAWQGPAGMDLAAAIPAVREALEHPRGFPAIGRVIVPGERVTIALDASIPQPRAVLEALAEVLGRAGVGPETLTVVAPSPPVAGPGSDGAFGGTIEVHDPDDRAR